MINFDIVGDRVGQQFICGFPIIGEMEQTGVFPRDESAGSPPDIESIWGRNEARLATRARASGALNARTMWGRIHDPCQKGMACTATPHRR